MLVISTCSIKADFLVSPYRGISFSFFLQRSSVQEVLAACENQLPSTVRTVLDETLASEGKYCSFNIGQNASVLQALKTSKCSIILLH